MKLEHLSKILLLLFSSEDKNEAEKAYKLVVKKMDTAAGKGIYHKNTVARKKSRLARMLNRLNAR